MVSFRIRGGLKEAQKFMKAIKVSSNISSTSLMDPIRYRSMHSYIGTTKKFNVQSILAKSVFSIVCI